MWSNTYKALGHVFKITKAMDRWTAKFAIGHFKLNCKDKEPILPDRVSKREARIIIDYWKEFADRCMLESVKIQTLKWISPDDVLAASSTVTVAIPGVAILSILCDTVKRNRRQEAMLIFWNENAICKQSNRQFHDNVANLFLPQLMKVKESLAKLDGDLEVQTSWIQAKLCDGEDEKSEELKNALDDPCVDEQSRKKCLKIRSSVENIVLALHRVEGMKSKLPEIFSAVIDDEDGETTL